MQAIALERSKHGAQSRVGASLLLASLPKKLTKIPLHEAQRVESLVARKPKARHEPLRLKSRRSPNKVLMCESLRRKVLSHESRRHGATSMAKEPKNTVKVLTSNAAGKACIVKTRAEEPTDVILPASQAKGGGASQNRYMHDAGDDERTKTHLRPRPRKGGWRFATVHPCTDEGQTRNFN